MFRKLSVLLMTAGAGALAASALLFSLSGLAVLGSGGPGYSDAGTVTGFGDIFQALGPTATPAATPPASQAPIERMIIPAIEVDAPVVVKGIDPNGVMQSPDGPWDVAWYDFTARPGSGSNAVFSGHVDYRDVGPAVFWRLRELQQGDLVQVRLSDSTEYRYQVTALNVFDASTAPIAEIVGPTPVEVVTLITCTGRFDPATRQYDQRLIVRAQRA